MEEWKGGGKRIEELKNGRDAERESKNEKMEGRWGEELISAPTLTIKWNRFPACVVFEVISQHFIREEWKGWGKISEESKGGRRGS